MKTLKIAGAALIITLAGSGCSTGLSGEKIFGQPGSEGWHETASWKTKNEYFKQFCRDGGVNDDHVNFGKCIAMVKEGHTPQYRPSITCRTMGYVTRCN